MKKYLCLVCAMFCAALAFAETSEPKSAGQSFTFETEHYRVVTDTGNDAAYALGKNAEALFTLYNDTFHFDPNLLTSRLTIRHFGNKEDFDAYLSRTAGGTSEGFVNIVSDDPAKSEMVCFDAARDKFVPSFSHVLFAQFLRGFIVNPPVWMREGFSAWFETASWDPATGRLSFPENLGWLETAKSLRKDPKRALDPVAILGLSEDAMKADLDNAYPQAWALVSFLSSTEKKEYNRFLWNSIASLRQGADAATNTKMILDQEAAWIGQSKFAADFDDYLSNRRSFAETVQAGSQLYTGKKLKEAETAFLDAVALDGGNSIPYYYLGLIAYDRKDYALADSYYRTALDKGGDKGLLNYALALSALARNDVATAKTYLTAAKEASPDKFGAKADELLKKLK